MTDLATKGAFGTLSAPDTLTIQRLLPGPIDRVWAHLTQGELRRQWLASGEMEMKLGAPFTLTWRNDTLTNPPGQRPEGFSAEHSMDSKITELDPPRRLSFTWSGSGDVTIELAPQGAEVLLTLTHRRLPTRNMRMNVSAGWHQHLDLMVARMRNEDTGPFWDGWAALKAEYEKRQPL